MADVTVVIPTHDRVRLLRQTLQSVQRQRGVDFEVVVVDDGSTEDTPGIVHAMGDDRFHVVRHERPLGVSMARNHGIAEARGRWVGFLDDDDLWAPHKLAAQLKAQRREGRLWSATGAVTIDDSLQVLAGEHPLPPKEIVAGLHRYNSVPVGASNVLADRALLERVGPFDRGLRHMSDWDMWIRMGHEGLPTVVDRPLVGYRLHAGAATMDSAVDPQEPLTEVDTIARRYGIPADRAAIHRWIAWAALRRGRRASAVRAYLDAIRCGDLRSILRLGIALTHPGVGKRIFFRPFMSRGQDDHWIAEARCWLRDLASA
jgi:glycosyltransferase involved in cell wall biosynthesis